MLIPKTAFDKPSHYQTVLIQIWYLLVLWGYQEVRFIKIAPFPVLGWFRQSVDEWFIVGQIKKVYCSLYIHREIYIELICPLHLTHKTKSSFYSITCQSPPFPSTPAVSSRNQKSIQNYGAHFWGDSISTADLSIDLRLYTFPLHFSTKLGTNSSQVLVKNLTVLAPTPADSVKTSYCDRTRHSRMSRQIFFFLHFLCLNFPARL